MYGLAREQVRQGLRVTVVTTDACSEQQRSGSCGWVADISGIHVARFPNLSNRLAYRHQLFLPRGAGRFLKQVAGVHDVFHLHGHRHLLNNLAVRQAQRLNKPVVMTPNGTLPVLERKAMTKRLYDVVAGNPVLRACQLFIAVSRAEMTQFRQAGIAAPRIRLVPNGFELEEFDWHPPRDAFGRWLGIGDAPMVLYLGKITPRKGVDHLIRALARCRERRAQLVIAGNDMTGEMGGLKKLVDELRLEQRVHFVGLLVGPRRLQALAAADVLVYPSVHEIFGLVPFEGLLSGAPVVVGDDCGCGELVARAGAGFLVPFGDVDSLAGHIDTLLGDRAAGAAMVERGRRYIEAHFAWPRVVQATDEVYRAAAESVPRLA